jgi:hypothetical protein
VPHTARAGVGGALRDPGLRSRLAPGTAGSARPVPPDFGFSRLDAVPDPSERVGMALITMCIGVTAVQLLRDLRVGRRRLVRPASVHRRDRHRHGHGRWLPGRGNRHALPPRMGGYALHEPPDCAASATAGSEAPALTARTWDRLGEEPQAAIDPRLGAVDARLFEVDLAGAQGLIRCGCPQSGSRPRMMRRRPRVAMGKIGACLNPPRR